MNLSDSRSRAGDHLFDRVPREIAIVVTAAALVAVYWLDRVTDLAPYQHLYYLPIVAAGVRFRYAGGIGASLAAIGLYHLANPHLVPLHYGESDIIQILLFMSVGLVAAALSDHSRRLHALAGTDDLTGLRNLRAFEVSLKRLIEEAQAGGAPLALLVLDLDRLKSLNDTRGHLAGAEAVKTVGQHIAKWMPQDAAACRYGGDEFAIVLPAHDALRAGERAESLRIAVSGCAPLLDGQVFPPRTLSISVGIAEWKPEGEGRVAPTEELGRRLFRRADAALYTAKRGGRNRVSVWAAGLTEAAWQ